MSKILLIGGCPRSGTGAMADLLTSDGRAYITQEKGLGFDVNSSYLYVGDKHPQKYLKDYNGLTSKYKDVKFIFTIRNGYGVIASYCRRILRKRKIEKIPIDHVINNTEKGQEIWLEALKQLKQLDGNNFIIIPYEVACNDTNKLCVELGNFLDYDTPVENKDRMKGDSIVKWYRPTNNDWEVGIEPWIDIIKENVSDEFISEIDNYYKTFLSIVIGSG